MEFRKTLKLTAYYIFAYNAERIERNSPIYALTLFRTSIQSRLGREHPIKRKRAVSSGQFLILPRLIKTASHTLFSLACPRCPAVPIAKRHISWLSSRARLRLRLSLSFSQSPRLSSLMSGRVRRWKPLAFPYSTKRRRRRRRIRVHEYICTYVREDRS